MHEDLVGWRFAAAAPDEFDIELAFGRVVDKSPLQGLTGYPKYFDHPVFGRSRVRAIGAVAYVRASKVTHAFSNCERRTAARSVIPAWRRTYSVRPAAVSMRIGSYP